MVCTLDDGGPGRRRRGPRRALVHRPEGACLRPDRDRRARTASPGCCCKAPAVPAAVASLVRQKLQPSGGVLPLPEPLRKRERLEVRPVPILHLHCPQRHGRPRHAAGSGRRRRSSCRSPASRSTMPGAEVGWQDGRGRAQPRQRQPAARPAPRRAVRGAGDRAPERARPAAAGPDRPRPLRARELPPGLHLRGGRGRRRQSDALGRVQPRRPAAARGRGLARSPSARTIPTRSSSRRRAWKRRGQRHAASTGSTSISASRSTASESRCCRCCSTCSSAPPRR